MAAVDAVTVIQHLYHPGYPTTADIPAIAVEPLFPTTPFKRSKFAHAVSPNYAGAAAC